MKRLRSAAPVALACSLAAGCAAAPRGEPPRLEALTPTEQFALEVRSTVDEILLAPHGRLSPAQEAALADLAGRWREAGEGPILVHAEAAVEPALQTAHAAAQALQAAGVPSAFVKVAPFEPAVEAPPGPVRVGYSRLVATGPQCANLWDNLTKTKRNAPYASFGCATTANLAAQIADPRDLVAPRASYPADAARRAAVLDKYRKGQPTGTERSDDERGDVSAAAR